jgi:broad specificity phosphatase PhoE
MSQKYCVLYIARHGETEWNAKRFFQGQKDSPLTESGIIQAQNLAKKLKTIHFDSVFSSDLLRAKRTAEIVTLERNLAIQTTALLRERNYGSFEGRSISDVKNELGHLFEEYATLSQDAKFVHSYIPEMESYETISTRFITFIREASTSYAGKTLLIVCHGTIMSAFLVRIGFAVQDKIRIENTGYFKLLSDGVDFFVKETEGINLL